MHEDGFIRGAAGAHGVGGGKGGRQGRLMNSSKSVWGTVTHSLFWAVTQRAILLKHFAWWHLTYLCFSGVSLRSYEMAAVIPILQSTARVKKLLRSHTSGKPSHLWPKVMKPPWQCPWRTGVCPDSQRVSKIEMVVLEQHFPACCHSLLCPGHTQHVAVCVLWGLATGNLNLHYIT